MLPTSAGAQPGLTLRHDLRPGDLGSIVHLHGTLYAREHGFDPTFEAYVAGPLAEFVRSRGERDRIWIAERGGRIVGCIAIVAASEREAQLRWFLVHPSARGMGLGRRLLDEAVGFCRESRFESVFLWTVSALTAAARLYLAAGFRRVAESPRRLWGVDVVEEKHVMALIGPSAADGAPAPGLESVSMKVSRPALVSEREFLALPESMERVELLDGEVIVSPSPSIWHQELLGRLVAALRGWAERQPRPVFVGLAPLDVRFAPGRILQPDAFVILDAVSLDRPGPIDRVPEVCIEVLSTNRAYDRLTKRLVYASAGVLECWLVEPSGVVERWHGQGLNEAEELVEWLASPLLPGFDLVLESLFRRGPSS